MYWTALYLPNKPRNGMEERNNTELQQKKYKKSKWERLSKKKLQFSKRGNQSNKGLGE